MEENKGLGEAPASSEKANSQRAQEVPLVHEDPSNPGPALPFDINKLCNFGFDVLKEAIEYLAKQQAEMNDRLGTLEQKDKEYVPITLVEKTKEV